MATVEHARYHSVAYRLPSLPPEIVHKVIGDLQLAKILEIVCSHNIPYIDDCIISHIVLGKIFTSDSLQAVKKFYTIYLAVCKRHRLAHLKLPRIRSLEIDAFSYLKSRKSVYNILGEIKAAILEELGGYVEYFPTLRKFSTSPIPDEVFWASTHSELERLLSTIVAAEDALNTKKSMQLERIALLIKENPGMLKMGKTQTQDPCRNEQHRIDHLLHFSQKILKPQILDRNFVAGFIFSRCRFYLEPYDR